MASSQDDSKSPFNDASSARHTPAASPAAHGLNDYTSADYSQHNDFSQLGNSTSSQSLFNNSFHFSAADPALFSDHQFQQSDETTFPDFVNNFDANAGASFDNSLDGVFLNNSYIDPSMADTSSLEPQISSQSLLAQMITSQVPTPPHILGSNVHGGSLSPANSPANANVSYTSPPPNHSRQQSLDPSSAAFPQVHLGDWAGSTQFQGHRRTLSDAHSDISSAQQSPFNPTLDDFNNPLGHSPHLQATDPVMFQDFGIGGVSLSEAQAVYITPSHSPHISPSISPNHNTLCAFPTIDNINLGGPLGNTANFFDQANMQSLPLQRSALDFTSFATASRDNGGKADAMSPPEISIQFAPPSRQASFEPQNKNSAGGGLNLPDKQRGRAKSDPSARGSAGSKDLLSPQAAGVGSRSPSPSNKGRRSSTSSVPPRDYILDLADPDRPANNLNESSGTARRTQKHPAKFQCNLCPKRFTRAYNLRSHLRTHTDERPFVCSHCGKAFARQHDRKRHEGLHSGEKKFECRGGLKDGNSWGCGRRFARADALGRHFRSEAGRICIKPLMDEEARERNPENAEPSTELGVPIMPMPNQQLGLGQQQPQPGFAYGVANQGMFQPGTAAAMPQMPMRLPTALLQQYPTLQVIWDTLPAGGSDEPEDVISGRSSYDASSAGEFDDDDQWAEGKQRDSFGWASDVGT